MPKFIIRAEETAVFSYEIEAADEDAAREIMLSETATCSGKFEDAVECSILTIDRAKL